MSKRAPSGQPGWEDQPTAQHTMSSTYSNGSPIGDDSGFESEDQYLYLDDGSARHPPLEDVNGKVIITEEDVEALRKRLKKLKAAERDQAAQAADEASDEAVFEDDNVSAYQEDDIDVQTKKAAPDSLSQGDYFAFDPNGTSVASSHETSQRFPSPLLPSFDNSNSYSPLPTLPPRRTSSAVISSRKSSVTGHYRRYSKSPSWSHIDRILSPNDLEIYNTIESQRRRRLTLDSRDQQPDNVRELGIPVKFDVHIKILVNSRPLFVCDWDTETETVRARRIILESYKYMSYAPLETLVHEQCTDLWREAQQIIAGSDSDDDDMLLPSRKPVEVNSALWSEDDGECTWTGPDELDLTGGRALLKLQEDGSCADMTIARTILYGNEAKNLKELRYEEWWKRIVDDGVLARYCVEFTIDMVLKV
ncbi:uncharacterized protein AB675_5375 [Cyphellophora attinorum]|uniref:Uncharacterized protein n=1 Tax=Cyphellophora attinorum TaxID=1664694 RepID=A0A0N1H721_9EURO|nr:uncharacterized protein AB675_5375 [Phialophora attinorum]KPI42050.1 hypothetical protein AB675_5375 [Phialophora attinorum]